MRHVAITMLAMIVSGAGAAAALDCFDYATALRVEGQVNVVHHEPAELAVAGGAAYSIGVDDPLLVVYDVTDLATPLAPVARDTLDLGFPIVDVDLSGDLAAVGMPGGRTRLVTLAYPFGMIGGYRANHVRHHRRGARR